MGKLDSKVVFITGDIQDENVQKQLSRLKLIAGQQHIPPQNTALSDIQKNYHLTTVNQESG